MTTASTPYPSGGIAGAFRRAEAWLDDRGRWAWIAATVLGFVLFWPVGLALLAYMIWSRRMFSRSCGSRRHRNTPGQDRSRDLFHAFSARSTLRSSGNAAFDAYKAETLRRLQDEQEAFEAFLNRLREAKDKKEFDAFMDDRARTDATREDASDRTPGPPPAPAAGY